MSILSRLSRKATWSKPTSMTSYWLRGRVRDDPQAKKYGPEPNKAAAEAVLNAAFTLAMKRRFRDDHSTRVLVDFAADLMNMFRLDLRRIDVETVIRAEFDEKLSVMGLDYRSLVLTKMLATPEALKPLNLSDRELDELFYAAEQIAVAQGFTPDPVPR